MLTWFIWLKWILLEKPEGNMELKNKKVIIIGMARSGISSAKLCDKLGAFVTLYDAKDKSKFDIILNELSSYNFNYIFGEFNVSPLDYDLFVLSPGIPTDLPFIIKAKELGVEVIGEIELAYLNCNSPIIAITGTNGKTTTTTLVGEIMKAYNNDTFVVGNIGNPFTGVALETKKDGIAVAEISSFQLESIKTFHPYISAILNLTEDHLNRHKTFENYINIKLKITGNQGKDDYCILNYDDKMVKAYSYLIFTKIIWFSMAHEVNGVYFKDNNIHVNMGGYNQVLLSIDDIFILGKHNIENIMAAVAISICMGVPLDTIKDVVKSFRGVEHRVEFVKEVHNIKFYNDSKATNPDSAIAAVNAMKTPTILIGGGMDKGNTFDEWIHTFGDKIKALVVFGETKSIIAETAKKYNYSPVFVVDTLEDAVKQAAIIAKQGDSVLLSPACASWDMFTSYEVRGQLFKELVSKL